MSLFPLYRVWNTTALLCACEDDNGPFKGSTIPMVDLDTYTFKDLNRDKITPEESFTDAYFKELYESEHVCTATKQLRVILEDKYK